MARAAPKVGRELQVAVRLLRTAAVLWDRELERVAHLDRRNRISQPGAERVG